MTTNHRILDGYRVLDCSIAMAGPFAAQRLGDLGADVVKVEPITGEWQRHAAAGGATGNAINVSFLSLNRNKRSLAVDLKSPRARQVLLRAGRRRPTSSCRTTGPGVAERLGVDYETLSAINPRLVYVSMSGLRRGRPVPRPARPGPAAAGDVRRDALGRPRTATRRSRPASTSSTRSPRRPRSRACSPRCCTASAPARASSCRSTCSTRSPRCRCRSCRSSRSAGMPQHAARRAARARLHPRAVRDRSRPPTATSRWRSPTCRRSASVIGEPTLPGDGRRGATAGPSATRSSVVTRGAPAGAGRPPTGSRILSAAGIWCGPVYGYAELVDDPQIRHNGTFVEYDHPTEGRVKTPGFPYQFSQDAGAVDRGAPLVGEHTARCSPRPGSRPTRSRRCWTPAPSPRRGCRIRCGDGAVPRPDLGSPARPGRAGRGRRCRAGPGHWDVQPLSGFESTPIEELAERYDLIVLDHPHLGDALAPPLPSAGRRLPRRPATEFAGRRAWRRTGCDGRLWALAAGRRHAGRRDAGGSGRSRRSCGRRCVELSHRAPVALSLAGPHALLTFASICVALGEEPAAADRFARRRPVSGPSS